MLLHTNARRLVVATAAIATLGCLSAHAAPAHSKHARHVILISVDGLHQSDLDTYVATHPGSTLAMLVNQGASYSNASTPFPSDSFPGLTALVTGGNPRSTGIYLSLIHI